MSHHISLLKNNSKKLRCIPHHLMPHHVSPLKIILKIQGNHLIPGHISPLKNNLKNSRKCIIKFKEHATSPYATSSFSIEK
jgi:hypothetical protein